MHVPGTFPTAIDAKTCYCAVYGYPVKHSASPAMQNAGLAELGLNWRYLAFEVHPEDLRSAISGAQAMHYVGLNLTVPHKLLALDMVDEVDPAAAKWGAVNTICFEGKTANGCWEPLCTFQDAPRQVRSHGYNTDADAITRSLSEDLGLELAKSRVLLLGAGGAGRTAALKLAVDNVRELFLVNRTESKAQAVAEEIRREHPETKVTVGYPERNIDLVLNATSLGLKSSDMLPFNSERFSLKNASAAYDMIYRPAETHFLAEARKAGCKTANGLGMLLYQGAKALEIWTGKPAPLAAMRAALQKEVYG